jgi:coenzyme Q-binding protein COQ10
MPSFSTTRRMPFTPRQMFDLVADVERYPEFLPLCKGLTVKKRQREGDKEILVVEMIVGYRAIRETFVSRVILDLARLQVDAGSPPGNVSGPFRQLQNRWNFAHSPEGCDVYFFISYEFKSLMLQMLVGSLFDRVFRRYTLAFEDRARTVYGPSGANLVSSAKARQGR